MKTPILEHTVGRTIDLVSAPNWLHPNLTKKCVIIIQTEAGERAVL